MTEPTPNSSESSPTALFVNCTLKKSGRTSNTRGLWDLAAHILDKEGIAHESIRVADYDLPPGIMPDMREEGYNTDDWPELFKKIISHDILIVGTPIWLGERSSLCSRFIERMYAMSSETNDQGQYVFYGKVAGTLISGNEDGMKHCAQGILYAMQHLGYTIPPQADAGWVGEAGPGPSYLDEESTAQENDFTNQNLTFMTYNLIHMARLLKKNGGIPAYGNVPEAWQEGQRWGFDMILKPQHQDE